MNTDNLNQLYFEAIPQWVFYRDTCPQWDVPMTMAQVTTRQGFGPAFCSPPKWPTCLGPFHMGMEASRDSDLIVSELLVFESWTRNFIYVVYTVYIYICTVDYTWLYYIYIYTYNYIHIHADVHMNPHVEEFDLLARPQRRLLVISRLWIRPSHLKIHMEVFKMGGTPKSSILFSDFPWNKPSSYWDTIWILSGSSFYFRIH